MDAVTCAHMGLRLFPGRAEEASAWLSERGLSPAGFTTQGALCADLRLAGACVPQDLVESGPARPFPLLAEEFAQRFCTGGAADYALFGGAMWARVEGGTGKSALLLPFCPTPDDPFDRAEQAAARRVLLWARDPSRTKAQLDDFLFSIGRERSDGKDPVALARAHLSKAEARRTSPLAHARREAPAARGRR